MSSLPPNLDPDVCWVDPDEVVEQDFFKILDNDGKVEMHIYNKMKNVSPDDRFRKNWSRANKPFLRKDTAIPGVASKFWIQHRYSPIAMSYFHSKKDGRPRVALSQKLKLQIPTANNFPEHASPIKSPKSSPTSSMADARRRLFPELYAFDDDLDLSQLDEKMPAKETTKPMPEQSEINETINTAETQTETEPMPEQNEINETINTAETQTETDSQLRESETGKYSSRTVKQYRTLLPGVHLIIKATLSPSVTSSRRRQSNNSSNKKAKQTN